MPRFFVAAIAAVPCFVLLLPAFAAAAVLVFVSRLVGAIASLIEPRFVAWTELMAFEPRLGWKPVPNLDTSYLADHDDVFRIVTDGEGWPGRRSIEQSDVVVIGDSFAFGYGVDTDRSFAEIDPSTRVKAAGAPGYSMVHGVLLLEILGRRLQDKLVVWFVFPENDLQDNLVPEMRRYRAPFVRPNRLSGQWEIVDDHVTPERWTCSDLDKRRLFPIMCVPGPIAEQAYSACEYLVERAWTVCLASGARLAVLTIPHPMQLTADGVAQLAALSGRPEACDENLPDRRLAASCERFGVPFVAGKSHLSRADYKRREGIHWNERGHRRIAGVVRHLATSIRAGAAEAPLMLREPARRVEAPASDFAATVNRSSAV